MLREKCRLLLNIHKALDILIVATALIAAYYTKKYLFPGDLKGLSTAPNYYLVLMMAICIHYLTFRAFSLYEPYRTQHFYEIFLKIIKSVAVGILILLFCLFLIHYNEVSRLFIVTFGLLLIILLTLSKWVIYQTLCYQRKRDYNTRNVLIIGCRGMATEMIKAILKNPGSGYRILGCLELNGRKDSYPVGTEVYRGVKVIGTLDDYTSIVLNKTVDEIIFAQILERIENINEIIHFAEEIGVNVRIMPDFQIQRVMYRPETARLYMDQFAGMPTIAFSSATPREGELLIKHFIDYTGAALGLLLLSPLFFVIACIIKATSPGPVFFSQQRCGINGRLFHMLKFRTMYNGSEQKLDEIKEKNEMDGPVFKMTNDPRITPFGKFLRRTSMDELPQLFNILKGEMSLIGPRPPIPEEVEQYRYWQRRRLSMKPGLTCIWQVSGRNNIGFDEWMRLDLQYIDNWSLWLDSKLFVKTLITVLFPNGR
ncbi:MAG: sugar transferase [Desulfobulbaceae bacterium]|nr:sugar transferase [Desulfobulbaceae bacterium]